MAQRRLLVIGSQCKALNRLKFLPEVAERLYSLLIDPGLGGCVGVPLEGRPPGLLLDPTVAEAKAAMERAIEDAGREGATLILAYIGHGEFPHERSGKFFLMPTDATEPTAREALNFVSIIEGFLDNPKVRFDLFVLLDACCAGAGAWQAMESWARSLQTNFSYVFLTATDDRDAANAPLTWALIELLEKGDPEAGVRLHGRDVERFLKDRKRPSQHVTYNAEDARFFLARNIAHNPGDVFWKHSQGRDQILKQTEYFQPTPQLDALVEAARSHSVVVLTGEAGAGKSTLAAALVRPELARGHVPAGFVHAIAVLGLTSNQRSVADDLERQLQRSLPGFAGAVVEFERSAPLAERSPLTAEFLPRMVIRPLAYLADMPEVRIVLDGFDQLPDVTRDAVGKFFGKRPDHLRLVITTRHDTPDCPPGHTIHHGPTPHDDINRYLAARRVPDEARPAILYRAGNHWLVARLLADAVLTDPAIDLAQLPGTVEEAYAKLLDQAGAADAWNQEFRPILGPLAAAGSGPVLPLPLLVHANKTLGGPGSLADVCALLARLRGLVVRLDADTPEEHAGLFHPTFADYLLGPTAASSGYTLDTESTHGVMVQAIDALAPMDTHDRDDPIHRYAFLREADHLGALGDMKRAIACLRSRESYIPKENLERLRSWFSRFRNQYHEDDSNVLGLRSSIASWTHKSGEARVALRLFSELLPEQERVLGRDHRDTLDTRYHISSLTGSVGNAHGALWLTSELLPEQERVLGRDHPDTLATRNDIAHWTGETGDAHRALSLTTELLPDRERVLGPDHPDTLATRNDIAHWTGETGDARGALWLSSGLLRDRERVLERDHPDTLATRNDIAHWTGEAGKARQALLLFSELLRDRERVLGLDHPDTLLTRRGVARWTGEAGDAREALRLFLELLPDQQRALGPDHPDTLLICHDVAHWTGEAGDTRESLRLCKKLLPDRERVLGRDHPATLGTRHSIAYRSGEAGDVREALRLFRELLPDRERVQRHDHPDTLRTRRDIARWTGEAGDAHEALQLFLKLLTDQQRTLKADHPDTLRTRREIARWTGEAGDAHEALRLLHELLPVQQRVLGPYHPATLKTRREIAHWTGVAGAYEALRLLRELLPDQQPDHPATLRTRREIARWTGEAGDAHEALRLLHELLPVQQDVLGPDHPDTLVTRRHIARWTGEAGDAREALRLFKGLLPDEERVLDSDTPTCSTPSVSSGSGPFRLENM
jgi:hypothetical protein